MPERHRAPAEDRRGALGLLAAVVALGLIGLGFHAIPAVVRVDRMTSVVAVPATAGSVDPSCRALRRVPGSRRLRRNASRLGPLKPTDKVHLTPKVPATGPGSYIRAEVAVNAASDRGRLIRFDVQVERNLAIDSDDAARLIEKVLNDRPNWRSTGRWRFQLVSSAGQATLHAYIVTPRHHRQVVRAAADPWRCVLPERQQRSCSMRSGGCWAPTRTDPMSAAIDAIW